MEQSVKILSEKSEKRSPSDVIDVDSLLSSFSSNPPSESSAFLPPAFGSPPFFPTSPSSSLHPMIPSLSGKHTRASSVQPTNRYFQHDCHGGASCWSGDSYSQSGGVLELEGEYLQPAMKLWPVVMVTTQLWVGVPPQVVSCSTKVPRHNSEMESHPRICLVSRWNVNPQLRVQVWSRLV